MTPAEKKLPSDEKNLTHCPTAPHKPHSRPPYAGRRLDICFLRAFPPRQGKMLNKREARAKRQIQRPSAFFTECAVKPLALAMGI